MPSSAPCCTAGGQTNATASRRGKMEVAARPIPSDPKNYERPWSATIPFNLMPDTELMEHLCENEKDLAHIIRK